MVIEIKKKDLRGEDRYKIFSIRIPIELCDELDQISANANISRNELVNLLLTEGIKSVRIAE